jgi:hypothetical protein
MIGRNEVVKEGAIHLLLTHKDAGACQRQENVMAVRTRQSHNITFLPHIDWILQPPNPDVAFKPSPAVTCHALAPRGAPCFPPGM